MDRSGENYEKIASSIFKDIYPYLVKDLTLFYKEDFKEKVVAEIGCGPGFILKELVKEKFSKIYGVDISSDMIYRASKRLADDLRSNPKLSLLCGRAENLPIEDNRVDIIISRGSIFFWENLNLAFKEICRVLKPKGFAMLGGGYGISTPESIVNKILENYRSEASKNSKPKLDIDKAVEMLKNMKELAEIKIIQKPKRGFWITFSKI